MIAIIILRTAILFAFLLALACIIAGFVREIRKWRRKWRDPRTFEFGTRWCRERGYIYREVENKDGGNPIRWWGVDMKGRHHKYRKGDE